MVASGGVGLAFAMVIGAGAASSLGACIVFCVGLASPRLLAGSLGFAAGVMIYVVFAEIYSVDSIHSFEHAGYSTPAATRLATACFFGGMALTAALDAAVHQMLHRARGGPVAAKNGVKGSSSSSDSSHEELLGEIQAHPDLPLSTSALLLKPGSGAAADIEMARSGSGVGLQRCCGSPETCCRGNPDCCGVCCSAGEPHCCGPTASPPRADILPGTAAAEVVQILQSDSHTRDLLRMGVVTGMAIALHNIPEGLASFVGALSDSKVGGSIAAAIAIHNIPEGICVAMPIFYATGSKLKGFMWGSLTGMAEPLGGLLGFLVLDREDPLSFGVVFGLVAGIMIYVSFVELLPAAFRFDAQNTRVSKSILAGMAVMAVSLLLFTL